MAIKSSKKVGLYDPKNEHDACGLGFIANIKGKKSHSIIQDGLYILENLEHRGATGADPLVGDGAGMLVQIPHDFFYQSLSNQGYKLPDSGEYAVGFFFFQKKKNFIMKSKLRYPKFWLLLIWMCFIGVKYQSTTLVYQRILKLVKAN